MTLRDDYKALEQSWMGLKDQYAELAKAAIPSIDTDAWFGDPLMDHTQIVQQVKDNRDLRLQRIYKINYHVTVFFKEDNRKIGLWYVTPNPNLGGLTPLMMIASGREDRLFKWVEEQMACYS